MSEPNYSNNKIMWEQRPLDEIKHSTVSVADEIPDRGVGTGQRFLIR
jgi:hypothetical protein